MSSALRSAAMLREYFGEILSHRPERSGLPSGVRGAGADRFGLPSGLRGSPAVGWFNHCAARGALNAAVTTTMSEAFTLATSCEVALRPRRPRSPAELWAKDAYRPTVWA